MLNTQFGIIPWNRKSIQQSFIKFAKIYENRPIRDNFSGMKSCHMFATWFILSHLQPKIIIESGLWKGQSTWIIEQACPSAQLHCIDINLHTLVYKSNKATYYNHDFSTYSWEQLNPEKTIILFDDHQNAYERVKLMKWYGFREAIFDDNYPKKRGDCYSLKKVFMGGGYQPPKKPRRDIIGNLKNALYKIGSNSSDLPGTVNPNDRDRFYLAKNLETYYEFPPLCRFDKTIWGDSWNQYDYPTGAPLFTKSFLQKYPTILEEAIWYTWICYIKLKK